MGCDCIKSSYIQAPCVSIHAPTWGATVSSPVTYRLRAFQSTHPHGVRLQLFNLKIFTIMFQSTHPHGVRPASADPVNVFGRFQSTHPHGVRLCSPILPLRTALCFNPRTHMGCDSPRNYILLISILAISICESIFNSNIMIICCLIYFLIC